MGRSIEEILLEVCNRPMGKKNRVAKLGAYGVQYGYNMAIAKKRVLIAINEAQKELMNEIESAGFFHSITAENGEDIIHIFAIETDKWNKIRKGLYQIK